MTAGYFQAGGAKSYSLQRFTESLRCFSKTDAVNDLFTCYPERLFICWGKTENLHNIMARLIIVIFDPDGNQTACIIVSGKGAAVYTFLRYTPKAKAYP